MRAALNHCIQSPGAYITKALQYRIWQEQPVGVSLWKVQPANFHDEVMVAHDPAVFLADAKEETIEEYRKYVPLLGMTWKKELKNWGEK